MAELSRHDVYVDLLLTEISLGYRNADYLADQLFPMVPVKLQTGFVPQYIQSDWFRNTAAMRATGTKSQRGGFTLDNTMTYACQRASFGFELFDEVRDNTVEPYNMDRDGTLFATDKVMMNRELAFATNIFKTTVWTDEVGGTDFTVFSDYGGSTPLPVITVAMDNVEGRIGREANVGVMGKQVFTVLRWHPDLLDTIKYTQRAIVTEEIMAALFGLEKLHIGRGIYTTSVEGTAEASVTYSRIWGKNLLLIYSPPSPSLITPAAGYTFVWTRVANALQYMKRMREEDREVDVLEANSYYHQKVTVPRAGEFLSGAVA